MPPQSNERYSDAFFYPYLNASFIALFVVYRLVAVKNQHCRILPDSLDHWLGCSNFILDNRWTSAKFVLLMNTLVYDVCVWRINQITNWFTNHFIGIQDQPYFITPLLGRHHNKFRLLLTSLIHKKQWVDKRIERIEKWCIHNNM